MSMLALYLDSVHVNKEFLIFFKAPEASESGATTKSKQNHWQKNFSTNKLAYIKYLCARF